MASIASVANQNERNVIGAVAVSWKANMELVISASHSSHILISQLKWKPPESCQKMSQSGLKLIKNFVQVATVQCAAL